MSDTLETLLLQLTAMKDAAQAMVKAEYGEEFDDDFAFDGENRIWLGLEQSDDDGGWAVGWLMRPDEATEFVILATGRTPTEAALNLRTKMIEAK